MLYLCPTWGWNLWPGDQESHALPSEPASHPAKTTIEHINKRNVRYTWILYLGHRKSEYHEGKKIKKLNFRVWKIFIQVLAPPLPICKNFLQVSMSFFIVCKRRKYAQHWPPERLRIMWIGHPGKLADLIPIRKIYYPELIHYFWKSRLN